VYKSEYIPHQKKHHPDEYKLETTQLIPFDEEQLQQASSNASYTRALQNLKKNTIEWRKFLNSAPINKGDKVIDLEAPKNRRKIEFHAKAEEEMIKAQEVQEWMKKIGTSLLIFFKCY
jgi:hypothetical protein